MGKERKKCHGLNSMEIVVMKKSKARMEIKEVYGCEKIRIVFPIVGGLQ